MIRILIILLLFSSGISAQRNFHNLGKTVPAAVFTFDTDALNYITRVEGHGVTIPDERKLAINTAFVSLKSNSLYTIPYDIYFFPWANAAANAEPLKGTAPDITWNGTVTHASTGITSDGTTGYGNLGFTPAAVLTVNNTHICLYSRTDAAITNAVDLGSGLNSTTAFKLFLKTGTTLISDQYTTSTSTGRISVTHTNTQGLAIATRVSTTDFRVIKNGTQLGSTEADVSTGTLPSLNIAILAWNSNGVIGGYSTREIILASVGAGFTTGQASTYSTIINTLVTAFGLNTY